MKAIASSGSEGAEILTDSEINSSSMARSFSTSEYQYAGNLTTKIADGIRVVTTASTGCTKSCELMRTTKVIWGDLEVSRTNTYAQDQLESIESDTRFPKISISTSIKSIGVQCWYHGHAGPNDKNNVTVREN